MEQSGKNSDKNDVFPVYNLDININGRVFFLIDQVNGGIFF